MQKGKSHNKGKSSVSPAKASGVHKNSNGALVPQHYHQGQQTFDRASSRVMRSVSRKRR